MKEFRKSLIIVAMVCFFVSVGFMLTAERGILDLARLMGEIQDTEDHISELEQSNQDLRRKIDLLQAGSEDVVEARIRAEYGLVKKNEVLYLESTQKANSPSN